MPPNSVLFLSPKLRTWKGFWLCTLALGMTFALNLWKWIVDWCSFSFHVLHLRGPDWQFQSWFGINQHDSCIHFLKSSRTSSVFCNWIYPRTRSTFGVLGSRLPPGLGNNSDAFSEFSYSKFSYSPNWRYHKISWKYCLLTQRLFNSNFSYLRKI